VAQSPCLSPPVGLEMNWGGCDVRTLRRFGKALAL
jgi:hypothetical protein